MKVPTRRLESTDAWWETTPPPPSPQFWGGSTVTRGAHASGNVSFNVLLAYSLYNQSVADPFDLYYFTLKVTVL